MDRPAAERNVAERNARKRRQDPVSCRLCRIKKLKCNRQQPCSNCMVRNAECEFGVQSAGTAELSKSKSRPASHTEQPEGGDGNTATILARLEQLEGLVTQMSRNLPPTPHTTETTPVGHGRAVGSSVQLSLASQTSSPLVEEVEEVEESHQLDAERLEVVGMRDASMLPGLSEGLTFEIQSPYDDRHDTHSYFRPPRRVLLPSLEEATWLFDQYNSQNQYFHHFLHLGATRRAMFDTYRPISERSQDRDVATEHSKVGLLLALCSSLAWFKSFTEADGDPAVAATWKHKSIFWYRQALDVLDHNRRLGISVFEDVQTSIVILFLGYHMEGFSFRCRTALASAISIAKDLSLHKIDSPIYRKRNASETQETFVELEMKRRVFWYLCATDWVIALVSGPQAGTYSISRQQMMVNTPLNVADATFEHEGPYPGLPISEPTPVSYFLYRIKIAEICRIVIDTLHVGLSEPRSANYETVLSLDQHFERFFEELPPYFRLDEESRRQSRSQSERVPQIEFGRYITNMLAENARCKLHQPFLIRGARDPRFAASTRICRTSAQTILHIHTTLRASPAPTFPPSFKPFGMLHHVMLAIVVLVMDLCFNVDQTTRPQRQAEVKDALEMLEEVGTQLYAAKRFLETTKGVLRKHQVFTTDADAKTEPESGPGAGVHKDNTDPPVFTVPGARSGHQLLSSSSASAQNPETMQSWMQAPSIFPQPSPLSNTSEQTPLSKPAPTMMGLDQDWGEYVVQAANSVPDWDDLFAELDAYIG